MAKITCKSHSYKEQTPGFQIIAPERSDTLARVHENGLW